MMQRWAARVLLLLAVGWVSSAVVPGAGHAQEMEACTVFRDCEVCPEMVVVPAGSFMMGSPENADEMPIHRVTIGEPFAVGKYEVTFNEWDACVADGGCYGHRPDDRGWGRGNRPVMNVHWNHVQTYTATCGSGCRTVGTRRMRGPRRMAARGSRETVTSAFCAAAPGTTTRGTSGPRSAAGTPPDTGAASSDSGLPED